jgi:MFS family permease
MPCSKPTDRRSDNSLDHHEYFEHTARKYQIEAPSLVVTLSERSGQIAMAKRHSYRELFEITGLVPLILTATLSRLGGRMFVLTLVLFVLARFSSPALAGWITFAAIVPGLLASPFAGTLVDCVGPTVALRIDMVASSIFVAAISGAIWLGLASPGVMIVLAILYSMTGPLGAAGTRTLIPRLVPPHALDQANAIDTGIFATVDVLGPALAGLTVVWIGSEIAIAAIAAVYAGAAICLFFVPRHSGLVPNHAFYMRQTLEGIQAVLRQPTLRGLAISYSLYQVTWGAFFVVVPVFVANHYTSAASDSVTGLLWSATGVAGGIGALVAGNLGTMGRERNIMGAGMALTALAVWPVAAEFGFSGLIVGLMLAGFLMGPIDVALLSLRQRRTDPRQLGRVMSISMSLNLAGFPLGSAIAGMMITSSLKATFILAGVASIAAAVATASIPPKAETPDETK